MSTDLDLHSIENAAKQLLDTRVDAVRTLARARANVADHTDQLRTAQAADKSAYDAALKAGWTPDELRKVGLNAPEKSNRTGRTAGRRSRSTSTTSQPAANETQH